MQYLTLNLTKLQVFHLTTMSMAFVNIKPLLPGHVLVSPRRVVPKLADLTLEEVVDLFITVQRITKMVERVYRASASNIAMQDGSDAGQSVPHVHVHIIPRKSQDLVDRGGQDAIYTLLEGEEGDIGKHLSESDDERPKFPKVDEAARKPRSQEDMQEEAEQLQKELGDGGDVVSSF